MLGRTLAALTVAICLCAAPAGAVTLQDIRGLRSATGGITLGPDGNLWVVETIGGNVVRMSPSGQVLNRYLAGSGTLSAGPDGRVWLADTAGDRFVWFDATAPDPSAHPVPTGFQCGPVALVHGPDDRLYFSLPNQGDGCGDSRVGSMSADGSGIVTQALRGTVHALAVAGGKVYAPDYEGDVVRRLAMSPALTVEAQITTPAGGGPNAIAYDGTGDLWVTLSNHGLVARFPTTQNIGAAAPLAERIAAPSSIVAGPGEMYVTGTGMLARISRDGRSRSYAIGGQPAAVVNGPDADLYLTDRAAPRVLRFVSSAPRLTDTVVDGGTVATTVDPRGNDTTVVVEYGPTAALGKTSPAVVVPAGAGGVPLTLALPADFDAAGSARVLATNAEGSAESAIGAVPRTPSPAPGKVALQARAAFKWAFTGTRTVLTKVEVSALAGGETVKVACTGLGCPFKSKTYKNVKAGKRSLTTLFGRKRKLGKGAKVSVAVTKAGSIGTKSTLTVRGRRQKPKVVAGVA